MNTVTLTRSSVGRILLHVVCLWRELATGYSVRWAWHGRGILREVKQN